MSDFFSTLASRAGTDDNTARKGVGALLATLQKHIPAEALSKVSAAIPESSALLTGTSSAGSTSPGSGGVAGIAGNLLGGKSAAATLASQFASAGFSPDMVKTFIPAVLGLLKDKLPPDVMNIVSSAVMPGSSGALGNLKKLF